MKKAQEPKYYADLRTGSIVNRASGEAIPDDEPIMIFRARDKHAREAIAYYQSRCKNTLHGEVIQRRFEAFDKFASDHPERMKEPDTDGSVLLSIIEQDEHQQKEPTR